MRENEVTLILEGEVTLSDFAKTLSNFTSLMEALSQTVASTADIVWVIDDLQAGSAETTIIGISEQKEAVEKVVYAYEVVGKALAAGQPIPYPDTVVDKARAITQIINGRISAIRFQTAEHDSVIQSGPATRQRHPKIAAFGLVKGRIETLNRRRGFKVILYDDLFDKPITCYLDPEQEAQMREIWGKRVTITGIVERDPEHGRITSVKDITNISTLQEVDPESYRSAKGIIPWNEGDDLPEVTIRRLRDAN
jgi:hypothetical protein